MKKQYDNVIPFLAPKSKTKIEHVDSTTIVEKSEMTDEQRKLFEGAYNEALKHAEEDLKQDWNPGVPS